MCIINVRLVFICNVIAARSLRTATRAVPCTLAISCRNYADLNF